jgi:predicted kinase
MIWQKLYNIETGQRRDQPNTMPAPVLILITGAPCTGKTTIAQHLAGKFQLPIVNKDGIKERLFDRLGWKTDRQWSKLLSLASYDLLYFFIEAQLKAGRSLIAEANFKADFDTPLILAMHEQYLFTPIQIFCYADPEILIQRFVQRGNSTERHPAHIDQVMAADIRSSLLKKEYRPLEVGGQLIEIDTTDLTRLDYSHATAALAQALDQSFPEEAL